MKNFILMLIAGAIALFCITLPVSAASLFFYPDVIESNPGETTIVSFMMEGAYAGLSGYSAYITIDDPTVATIKSIEYPCWADYKDNWNINGSTYKVMAADSRFKLLPGESLVSLAELEVYAKTAGYATISAVPVVFDDDWEGRYEPYVYPGTIMISGAGSSPVVPVPMQA